jgi:hypothetical protein
VEEQLEVHNVSMETTNRQIKPVASFPDGTLMLARLMRGFISRPGIPSSGANYSRLHTPSQDCFPRSEIGLSAGGGRLENEWVSEGLESPNGITLPPVAKALIQVVTTQFAVRARVADRRVADHQDAVRPLGASLRYGPGLLEIGP